MKIRTIKHIVKEGAVNSYRNKLMSLASVVVVVATLIIFGFFLMLAFNLEANISVLKEQPQLEAFCYSVLDDAQIQTVEKSIKNNDKIAHYEKVTKEQALKKMEEKLGKDAAALEGYDASIFPVSFIIKLSDTAHSEEVVKALETTSGVEKVSYSKDAIEIISRVSYWVKFLCSLMMTILLVVSVFIIANTIKLTVFARRKEINIMKYIGATDWFIRWPFVVEGVIIGITGAVLAFALSIYGYNVLEEKFAQELLSLDTGMIKMIRLEDIWIQLVVPFLAIGTVVGAIGSFFSIRKYLRV